MMVIKFRHKRLGDHVHVDCFVGEDGEKLALAGRLVLRFGEWQLVGAALGLGAKQTLGHLTFITEEEKA